MNQLTTLITDGRGFDANIHHDSHVRQVFEIQKFLVALGEILMENKDLLIKEERVDPHRVLIDSFFVSDQKWFFLVYNPEKKACETLFYEGQLVVVKTSIDVKCILSSTDSHVTTSRKALEVPISLELVNLVAALSTALNKREWIVEYLGRKRIFRH